MTQKQQIIFAFAAAGFNVGLLIDNTIAGNTGLALVSAASALLAAAVGIAVSRK